MLSRPGRARRSLRCPRERAALTALLGLAALACSPPPVSVEPGIPISGLHGRLIGAPEVLALAGKSWRRSESGRWVTDEPTGTVLVRLERAVKGPLEFVVEGSSSRWFAGACDDGEFFHGRRGHGRAVFRCSGPETSGGEHRFTLRSTGSADHLDFQRIGWRLSGETSWFPPSHVGRDGLLWQFLDTGVARAWEWARGGFATLGNPAVELDLGSTEGGVLTAELDNVSARPATVTLSGGERADLRVLRSASVPAGTSHDLRVEIPHGTRRVRLALSGLAPLGLTLWSGPTFAARESRVPLVLMISLDTTRRDLFGVYGDAESPTPNLDRLAGEATVYERASSTSSWTLPAHASAFTGLYPDEHRAGFPDSHLRRDVATLAALLSPSHLAVGFGGGPLLRPIYGLGRGFDLYSAPHGDEELSRSLVDRAMSLLEAHRDEPTFLFLNLFDPHYPYRPPADLPQSRQVARAISRLGADSPWAHVLEGDGSAYGDWVRGQLPADAGALHALVTAYRGEAAEMDREVGRLLDFLRASGRYESALIVVFADHGELLGEGGFFTHGMRLDPELVDIPLFVKYPHQREPRRVAEPTSLVDVFPTVLAVTGTEVPPNRGVDLRDLAALKRREGVFFEEEESPVHRFIPEMRIADVLWGVDDRRGRIVRWPGGESCQGGVPGFRSTRPCSDLLRGELEKLRAGLRGRPVPPLPPGFQLPPDEQARLRALGYL